MMRFLAFMALCLTMSAAPSRASDRPVDPQVTYANAHGSRDVSYRQGWFGKGDTRLHYVEAGEGPLILFYHGFPSNWFSWFDAMEALKGRYRVVAVDALGAGLSAKPEALEPYRIDRLGKQLDRLAQHLDGNRRFILVGHDWGGALALGYAQAYPARLHAVVGMSAPPYNLFLDLLADNAEQRQRSTYMQQFRSWTWDEVEQSGFAPRFATQVYGGLRDGGQLSPEEAALFIASVGRDQAMNGGLNWYRANIPPIDRLDRSVRWPSHDRPIATPVLMIWGDDDQTFVPDFLEMLSRSTPQLSIARLPATGHMTPIDRSARSIDAIARFLGSICGDTPPDKC